MATQAQQMVAVVKAHGLGAAAISAAERALERLRKIAPAGPRMEIREV